MSEHVLLSELYGRIGEGVLNVWAKHSDGRKLSRWFNLAEGAGVLDRAQDAAAGFDAQGFDSYFGVCLAAKGKSAGQRITQKDVFIVPAYFVDCDTLLDAEKDKSARLPVDVNAALEGLGALPYPPSLIMGSGHGAHAYWVLNTPLRMGDALTLDELRTKLKAFGSAVSIATGWSNLDVKASEPARVLRMEHTHNHKESTVLPVELVLNTGARYDAAVLDAWAQSLGGAQVQAKGKGKRKASSSTASTRAHVQGAEDAEEGTTQDAGGAAAANVGDYEPGGRYYLSDSNIWDRLNKKLGVDVFAGENAASVLLRKFNGDASSADMALLNELAFLTGGNAGRMDKLFRKSELFRDKWDEVHSGSGLTYGEMSIAKAIDDATCFYTGGDFRLQDVDPGRRAEIEELRKAHEEASDKEYSFANGGVVRVTHMGNGDVKRETLCNFYPRVREIVTLDDGAEKLTELVMDGFDRHGAVLPVVHVPAEKLARFDWLRGAWSFAVVKAGQMVKDRLREDIERSAEYTAQVSTTYLHTGWRMIDGRWVYLHGAGAVGGENIHTDLARAGLTRFVLPAVDVVPMQDAVRSSLAVLHTAPTEVTLPLLAQTYLGALNEWMTQGGAEIRHVLVLCGLTGAGKSTLAALAQAHYGAGFDAATLPANFMSTQNATLDKLFYCKDALCVIDDYHPAGDGRGAGGMDAQTSTLQAICRAAGDKAARQRMRADMSMRPEHPARCVCAVTAEFFPPALGESGAARCWICNVERDSIDWAAMSTSQDAARLGVLAQAMRGFIEWIGAKVNAEDGGAWSTELGKRYRECRDELRRGGGAAHARLPSAGAALLMGWKTFLHYANCIGAITTDDFTEGWRLGVDVIRRGMQTQALAVHASDPVRMFGAALLELLGDSERFIDTEHDAGEGAQSHTSKGICGYIAYDADEEGARVPRFVYCKPTPCTAAIQELARQSDSRIALPKREIWQRLYKLGITKSAAGKPSWVPGRGTDRVIRLDVQALARYVDDDAGR